MVCSQALVTLQNDIALHLTTDSRVSVTLQIGQFNGHGAAPL
jgi:hypothetical protein